MDTLIKNPQSLVDYLQMKKPNVIKVSQQILLSKHCVGSTMKNYEEAKLLSLSSRN